MGLRLPPCWTIPSSRAFYYMCTVTIVWGEKLVQVNQNWQPKFVPLPKMCACCVHDHDYCRSSATDINQQDRPWGLLMAAKSPFDFHMTSHVTSHYMHWLLVWEYWILTQSLSDFWVSVDFNTRHYKRNQKHYEIISATHKIHKAFERTSCFLSWECKPGYHTIIVFAGPFQTTTPETGSVVSQGASAETHSQNEQQDGAGEVRETKLSKLLMISYYFSCITLFYSWHGAAWAGVWRQTKVALNFSKGTDF